MRFLWHTKFLKQKVLEAGLFGRTTLASNPDLKQYWVDRMKPIQGISMKHAVEAVLSADSILDLLPAIDVPTIVGAGKEDTALPLFASQEINQRIRNSELVEIDLCGHSLSIEQPDVVDRLLEKLILQVN